MGRPRKLPTSDILREMRVTGNSNYTRPLTGRNGEQWPSAGPWTYDQIAYRFEVTRAAVHMALRQAGVVVPQRRHELELPWKIAVADNNHLFANMLRMASRIRRGDPIPEYRRKHVEQWIAALATPLEGAPYGCVIDYCRGFYTDPRTGEVTGWGRVPRRPEIDQWLIREPRVLEDAR